MKFLYLFFGIALNTIQFFLATPVHGMDSNNHPWQPICINGQMPTQNENATFLNSWWEQFKQGPSPFSSLNTPKDRGYNAAVSIIRHPTAKTCWLIDTIAQLRPPLTEAFLRDINQLFNALSEDEKKRWTISHAAITGELQENTPLEHDNDYALELEVATRYDHHTVVATLVRHHLENGIPTDPWCKNIAATCGSLESLKTLLGLLPYAKESQLKEHKTLMKQAAWGDQLEIVKMLIEHNSHASLPPTLSKKLLMSSCSSLGARCAQWLIEEKNADPHEQDRHGMNALAYACRTGNAAAVKVLVGKGVSINKPDNYGKTPLMHACSARICDPRCAQVLLERGANPNLRDTYGYTALTHACIKGHLPCMKFLLDAGADPNKDNELAREYFCRFVHSGDHRFAGYSNQEKEEVMKLLHPGNTTNLFQYFAQLLPE